MLKSVRFFVPIIFLFFVNPVASFQSDKHEMLVKKAYPPEAYPPKAYTQKGKASFYATSFDGKKTASGAVFKNNKMTAAHKTLPFGTKVKVTNLKNKKTVTVEINDRGPFVKGRIIDLSRKAAKSLGMISAGSVDVLVEVVKPAPGYSIADSGMKKKK